MTAAQLATPGTLWHVTLLLSGEPTPVRQLGRALQALCALDPGNMGVRYQADRAELQFWDEGADILEVARGAAELWGSSRQGAGLPDWSLVGLQVLERSRWRERQSVSPSVIPPGSVGRL